jgi:hypothetical protein
MYNLNDSNAHPEQLLPYSTPVSDLCFKFRASSLLVMNSFESSRFLVTLVGAFSSSIPLSHDILFTIKLSHGNHISYRDLVRVFHYSHRAHCLSKPIKRRSHAVCQVQLPPISRWLFVSSTENPPKHLDSDPLALDLALGLVLRVRRDGHLLPVDSPRTRLLAELRQRVPSQI